MMSHLARENAVIYIGFEQQLAGGFIAGEERSNLLRQPGIRAS